MAAYGDDFTEAAGTPALTSHTPTWAAADGTLAGSGWTSRKATGAVAMRVNSTSDREELSADELNDAYICTMQPNPTVADYEVETTLPALSTSATSPTGLVARLVDADNYYFLNIYRDAEATDRVLGKMVANVASVLASGNFGTTAGDVFALRVEGTTISAKRNAATETGMSVSDAAFGAAGECGLGCGGTGQATGSITDDARTAWKNDPFKYTEIAAAVTNPLRGERLVNRGVLRGVHRGTL